MLRLSAARWRARRERHAQRAEAALGEIIHRRDRGLKHPVDDFLFHYYNLRPSQLMRWHPGIGVAMEDAGEFESRPFYDTDQDLTYFSAAAFLAKRRGTVVGAQRLLAAASQATPRFGCFGMHEWAMVYRLEPGETRHPYLPLRYPPAEIARIVEEVGCRCSHIDAFRFFTAPAKPLNLLQPTREQQSVLDQPGCLHVNMDLYRWAGKLTPAVSSELLLQTFELAREIRVVDMAASAYDLSAWGIAPIAVETPEGRADYVQWQREFAERAAPLRTRLLETLEQLLADARYSDAVAHAT